MVYIYSRSNVTMVVELELPRRTRALLDRRLERLTKLMKLRRLTRYLIT